MLKHVNFCVFTLGLSLTTLIPASDLAAADGDGSVAISGELKRWHKVTLTLAGPEASETGDPNPFTDYRMTVTFTNGNLTYEVPGYFAADGNAAESSATSGNKWRAHLSPDLTGTWSYNIDFRQGNDVAIHGGGTEVSPYDGVSGTFDIAETDKTGRDLRGRGRLEVVPGERYLRFKGTGEYFIKVGADAPENLLAYEDFDGPFKNDGAKDDLVKDWQPHEQDWNTGDPTWQNGKGKGLIGAINYLAGKGMNVFSFLTFNVNGDDQNVFPHINNNERLRMDVSRLDQWEIVFEHATRNGMYLHFKTQEEENERLLDDGEVGTERTLYYRELVARFGHHLALNWNLGEENGPPKSPYQTEAQRKDMAQWFRDNDPYGHHIVLHTRPDKQDEVYTPLLGASSELTGASVQTDWDNVHGDTLRWIRDSTDAGKPWVVANDEQGKPGDGIPPDPGWPGFDGSGPSRDDLRHQVLWGNLMAGGAGVEAYFGYKHPQSDLTADDWRSRDGWWDMNRHAKAFFDNHLPFTQMESNDQLVGNSSNADGGNYCFADIGEIYACYFQPGTSSRNLDLSGATGSFEVAWYDPRNGGTLQNGSIATVEGGGTRDLGDPPNNTDKDWVALVRKDDGGGGGGDTNQAPEVVFTMPTDGAIFAEPADLGVVVDASDNDGVVEEVSLWINGEFVRTENESPYEWGTASPNNNDDPLLALPAGNYTLKAEAIDDDGATGEASITISVESSSDPPGNTVIAINAGGPDFVAADGTSYVADQNFTGGSTFSLTDPIDGTEDDTLYQSERWGTFSYEIPIADGTYDVTLQFAEIYFDQTGERVFDVQVEGDPAVTDLDIVAEAGGNFTAHDITVTATVSDGALSLNFPDATVDNAKLSAVVVRPASTQPPANVAINAGGPDFVAADGTSYVADQNFTGGSTFSVTDPIDGTEDDLLYQSERWGTFSYEIPIADGTYDVTLQFAEIFFDQTGERVFDVQVEGDPAVTDLDIVAEAGGNFTAHDITVTATVSDGALSLNFPDATVDNAKLSAVVVRPADATATSTSNWQAHVFYNNSAFDGNDPQAGASDDQAIATDKRVLRPGEQAGFAHYTSYVRGINGLMLDIPDLPGVPEPGDFDIQTGNSANLDEWQGGPAPATVSVRSGAGVDGSDRVTLIWPDQTFTQTWLRVQVAANGRTGLAEPMVFYFGNMIGETGDDPDSANVNATDEIAARNNPRNVLEPAPVTDPHDFNRDQRVDATDQIIARNHPTNVLNALKLFVAP